MRFVEAEFAQMILEPRELCVRGDRDDRVDVEGRSHGSGGRISQQQSGNAAADERNLIEHRF